MTSIWDLDTPVPLVDVNRLESNLGRMAADIAQAPTARHRPHAKTHKTREVARRQLASPDGAAERTRDPVRRAVGDGGQIHAQPLTRGKWKRNVQLGR